MEVKHKIRLFLAWIFAGVMIWIQIIPAPVRAGSPTTTITQSFTVIDKDESDWATGKERTFTIFAAALNPAQVWGHYDLPTGGSSQGRIRQCFFKIIDSTTAEVKVYSESGSSDFSFESVPGHKYTVSADGGYWHNESPGTGFAGRAIASVSFSQTIPDAKVLNMNLNGKNMYYSMYLPADSPASGSHTFGESRSFNSKNDLLARPYPIHTWYEVYVGDNYSYTRPQPPNAPPLPLDWYKYSVHNAPWFKVSSCDSNGSSLSQIIHHSFYSNIISGEFDIPANQGILVEMNTGDDYTAFKSSYRIIYHLDQAPPDIPGGLAVRNLHDGGVYSDGAKTYTRYNSVTLDWNIPNDNVTMICGHTYGVSGPGGTTGYTVGYKNLLAPQLTETTCSQNNCNIDFSALPDGEYQAQIRARDFDNNQSGYSLPLKFVVDRSVDNVMLTEDPILIMGDKITFNWVQVNDSLSGINRYQVALTETLQPPGESQVVDVENVGSYEFMEPVSQIKAYYAWVRAVDNVGNISSSWTRSEAIVSPPEVTGFESITPSNELNATNQPVYQIRLQFKPAKAARFIIERTTVGDATAKLQITLNYDELADAGFVYTDTNNLTKHGQYCYRIWTENGESKSAEIQSGIITIPNLPAQYEILGPDDQTVSAERNQTFDLTPEVDLEGDQLKFRVWYKNGNSINKSSDSLQNNPVIINFPNGTWEWWLEIGEYNNDTLIENTIHTTNHRTITIQSDSQLPINLPEFNTTPGRPVQFGVISANLPNPIAAYQWNPGDGSEVLSGATPEHTYNKLGTYILTVAITDSTGTIYTASTSVNVANTTSGILHAGETWSGIHRIYGTLTVPTGVTLTIESKTQVIIEGQAGGAEANGSLIVQGKLNANEALFKSQDGYWDGIYVTGEAILDQVTVINAVRGLAAANTSKVEIGDSIFQDNQFGLHVYGCRPTVTNSSFLNNTIYGIKEDEGGQPQVIGCKFSGNAIDYYHETLTEISLDELNQIPGNEGNTQ